jgi:hypothetical protein
MSTIIDGNGAVNGVPIVVASQAEAEAGTNNAKLMTPLRTKQAVDSQFNVTGNAPKYACRAWVNFDGTTSPGTIRASGNVSSVTKNGTGDYTVNFTTAMPDVNFSAIGTGNSTGTGTFHALAIVSTESSSVRFRTWGSYSATVVRDVGIATLAVFR